MRSQPQADAATPPTLSRAEFVEEALPHLEASYRFARRLCQSRQSDADDLVQETFLRAYRSRHTFAVFSAVEAADPEREFSDLLAGERKCSPPWMGSRSHSGKSSCSVPWRGSPTGRRIFEAILAKERRSGHGGCE